MIRRNNWLLGIICFLFIQPILPQQNDFRNIKELLGDVFSSPFHFNKNDLLKFGMSSGSTAGAFLLDKSIKSFAQSNRFSEGDIFFSHDKYFVEITGTASLITYIYGLSIDNPKTRSVGLQLTEAFIAQGAIVSVIKMITGRARPFNADDNILFSPFSFEWENTSFPSGHTSTAFSLAVVLSKNSDNIYTKIASYSLATLVGFGRIYNNHHWFSDVVAGAILGYAIGEFVVNNETNNYSEKPSPPVLHIVIPF